MLLNGSVDLRQHGPVMWQGVLALPTQVRNTAVGEPRGRARRPQQGNLTDGDTEKAEAWYAQRKASRILRSAQVNLCPVPLDDGGLDHVVREGLCKVEGTWNGQRDSGRLRKHCQKSVQPPRDCPCLTRSRKRASRELAMEGILFNYHVFGAAVLGVKCPCEAY